MRNDVNPASLDSVKVNINFLDHENMYADVPSLRPSIVFSFTLIIYMYVQVISNKVDDKSLKKIIIIIPKKKDF